MIIFSNYRVEVDFLAISSGLELVEFSRGLYSSYLVAINIIKKVSQLKES